MFQHLRLVRPLVIIDIETTGLNPATDRILELAVIKFTPTGERLSAVQRINPCIPIPATATALHGIRDVDVANEPSFADVACALHQCNR